MRLSFQRTQNSPSYSRRTSPEPCPARSSRRLAPIISTALVNRRIGRGGSGGAPRRKGFGAAGTVEDAGEAVCKGSECLVVSGAVGSPTRRMPRTDEYGRARMDLWGLRTSALI